MLHFFACTDNCDGLHEGMRLAWLSAQMLRWPVATGCVLPLRLASARKEVSPCVFVLAFLALMRAGAGVGQCGVVRPEEHHSFQILPPRDVG